MPALLEPRAAGPVISLTVPERFGWEEDRTRRDLGAGFFLALLVHAGLLAGSNAVFYQEARYGVEAGTGGLEVSLVAASGPEEVIARESPEEIFVGEEAPTAPAPVLKTVGNGSSSAGARSSLKPSLRNPAPFYPEAARRAGQEGLVKLSALVNEKGFPIAVELLEGSGYPLLDQASLKAVRRWRFEPARVGSLPVRSRVEIPIRFQLKEEGEIS